MININSLTEKDVGKWVIFSRCDGKKELGKVKSWNDTYIFVVYKCADEWERFEAYTGAATNPEDLTFCEVLGEPPKIDVYMKGRDYEGGNKE